VIQRLFGLSLVLGSGEPLGPTEQQRAADELQSALADLRSAMQRTGEPAPAPPSETLTAEIERLIPHYPQLEIAVAAAADPPPGFEPLAQSVLAEGLHNAVKHATPTALEVRTSAEDGTFVLEIRNDGVTGTPGSAGTTKGMGLNLAALDAIGNGGVLEFGPVEDSGWRLRLVLPVEEATGL
jgi:signal transduction histidine kinase